MLVLCVWVARAIAPSKVLAVRARRLGCCAMCSASMLGINSKSKKNGLFSVPAPAVVPTLGGQSLIAGAL